MNGLAMVDKADSYDKYEAERDLRSLTEAELIRKDKKRMANVKRAAKEKLAEMEQIKNLSEGK